MKKTTLLAAILFAFCSAAFPNTQDELVKYAQKFIGWPYRAGGTGPHNFDCSGFTKFVFSNFGYKLSHNSAAQASEGIRVARDEAQKGDLIFFKGQNANSSNIGHVGIVVSEAGETPVRFVHASTSSGIRIDNVENNYYRVRYIAVARVLSDNPDQTNKNKKGKEEKEKKEKPQAAPSGTRHTVRKGDTMYNISKRYGCTIDQLRAANNISGNEIRIGQQLFIPSATEKSDKSAVTHIVRKGETLYRISKKYGCTVSDIQRWNNLNGTSLSIGQEIFVRK